MVILKYYIAVVNVCIINSLQCLELFGCSYELTEGINTAVSQGIISQAEETILECDDHIVLVQCTIIRGTSELSDCVHQLSSTQMHSTCFG